jgi:hypothetical protein
MWLNRDREDDQDYENWRRFGHQRGWFDRAADDVRAFFGDEDAQRRRTLDRWQSRDYDYDDAEERERDWQPSRGYRGTGFSPGWGEEPTYIPNRPLPLHEPGLPYEPAEIQHQANYFDQRYLPENGRWEREYSQNRPYGRPYGMGTYGDWGPFERWRPQGTTYGGGHSGRGPRNYRRSDEIIREEVMERLTRDPMVDASDIDVTVTEGDVTLTGMVDDRRQKRAAADIAEDVFGVKNVQNRLRVRESQGFGPLANRGSLLQESNERINKQGLTGGQTNS